MTSEWDSGRSCRLTFGTRLGDSFEIWPVAFALRRMFILYRSSIKGIPKTRKASIPNRNQAVIVSPSGFVAQKNPRADNRTTRLPATLYVACCRGSSAHQAPTEAGTE